MNKDGKNKQKNIGAETAGTVFGNSETLAMLQQNMLMISLIHRAVMVLPLNVQTICAICWMERMQ